MAVKKTQMYRRNLDGTETNLNPLTESQYVLMENGQTVQEVLSDRDSDKYTPVITNSSSTFKVGQGDNVDLSSSMKEGAYDSCVLKGKTMVNCIQEPSSKDVVLPYEFADGQYVTINDTKESGALGVELKGQTLVNVLNYSDRNDFTTYGGVVDEEKYITFSANNSWNSSVIFKKETAHLKPNTRYTIMLDIKENTITQTGNESIEFGSANSVNPNGYFTNALRPNLVGVKGLWKGLLTTKSSFDNIENSAILLRCYAHVSGVLKVRVSIIEGDYTNVDIPYFTGMASCKMPILSTVGKNLATVSSVRLEGIRSNSGGHSKNIIMKNIPVEEGKTYTISGVGSKSDNMNYISFTRYEHRNPTNSNNHSQLWNEIGIDSNSTTFTIPKGIKYVSFTFGNCVYNNNGEDGWLQWDSIQLEEGSVATSYEPHKSSILSLPEEVVLRSLPNGVCDTFNTRTGVYTQNVKEVTFNGSENWIKGVRSDTTVVSMFYLQLEDLLTNAEGDINDLFIDKIFTSQSHVIWDRDVEGIHNKRSCLYININNSRMSDVTIEAFKTWLSQNSITVQYQLVEPIVTKINLSSTLKSWNTTTHIYSEIPENTLYPILSHSNPTYPVILKPSTKYSIVANSYSNSHTNSAINFNLGGATTSTTVGSRVTTITTPSTLSNELLTMSGRGNKLNNVMVVEGDVVGDEPYFEGICDCKSPILLNCGKNLFDGEIEAGRWLTYGKLEKYSTVTTGFRSANIITITPSSRYTISGNFKASGYFVFGNKDGYITRYIGLPRSSQSMSFNTNPDECYGVWYTVDIGQTEVNKPTNIQLEEASTATSYKPYKSNILSFNQKDDKTIVLRSLPNGVCDTLNVETGEYVQRIGEVNTKSLQTTVNLSIGAEANVVFVNGINGKFIGWNECNVASDKLQWTYRADINWSKSSSINGIAVEPNGGFWFIVDKTIETKEQANEFLVNLDATIQYELTTPIVSTIDVQGFPYAYANGHVQLSSGSIEQSLTPKVEYSLSANKTGQINSNTKRVSAHQKQLDDFEAMMLTQMVQSAYDKAILQFDYEMQMMSLGGE